MTDPHAMAFSGDVVSLRHFLAPLPKPAAANTVSAYRKTTMLYSAARSGHLPVVRMLVEEFGADVNRRNESEDGSSPLHGACYGGHGDVVRYLLQRGADASRKNNYKERPRTNAENPAAGVTPAAAQECRDLIDAPPPLLPPLVSAFAPVPVAVVEAASSVPSTAVAPPPPPAAAVHVPADLAAKGLPELRKLAASLGLPATGAKTVIAERIAAHQAGTAAPTGSIGTPLFTASAAESPAKKPPMTEGMQQGVTATPAAAVAASPSPPVVAAPPGVSAPPVPPELPFDGAWLDQLRGAAPVLTEVPRDTEDFWNLEEKVMACNQGHNEDYVANRLKKKKKPLTFIVKRAWKVTNPVLEAAFQQVAADFNAQDKALGRVRTAFHGTRDANIDNICRTSLLRFGHPLNPCKTFSDDGYFGTNKKGVYVSRYFEYTLKYSNDLTPLEEGQTAKVIMFRCLPGKCKQIEKLNMGMDPTAGFHSHSSPSFLEWYLFDERQLCPEYVVEIQATIDTRTAADDE
jgi:hypothetical protein